MSFCLGCRGVDLSPKRYVYMATRCQALSQKIVSSSNVAVSETSNFDRGDFWLVRFQKLPVISILILLSQIILVRYGGVVILSN